MVRWQKRARIGVGLFGLAFAIVVYAAIGERQANAPLERPSRLDPRAILESAGAALQQFQAARKDYVVKAERQLTYEGGATKFIGVTIEVKNRGGRDFVVSGREAQSGENKKDLQITGDVKLVASDGFTVTADEATFNQDEATVHVPGAVDFHKGRMSGSGAGMTYNQSTDVLTLAQEARVALKGDDGQTTTEFDAASATLSRQTHSLALEGSVHALRNAQVLESQRAVARFSENDEFITFIELRGDARVEGGEAFDSMTAGDIDLDYTDDGALLERASLRSKAEVITSVGEGEAERRFIGDSLEMKLAPDSSLTAVTGRGNVRLYLPGRAGVSPQSVTGAAVDATGEPGKGLTAARFGGGIEYREEAQGGRASRNVRSDSLRVALVNDAVTSASFTGHVRFEEQKLQASGAQAEYDPGKGGLQLAGIDSGGGPRVSDSQIRIEAPAISVTLEGPQMHATGGVKTVLSPPEKGRLPGLLDRATPANVNANALEYDGQAGTAAYAGNATLWQGETAIRGETITLDRTSGNLHAVGAARSNLVLDAGVSIGRGEEIRYDDTARRISYGSPLPATPPASAPAASTQLSGPQGDLRAVRIEVTLAKTASQVERLEAYTAVQMRLDKRLATGDRLTYHAEDERYVMTGIATVPVKIVEECRETSGRTVVFFKSADRIIVDGNEEVRTQSSRGGPCPQPAPR